jgi:hypothetical protein
VNEADRILTEERLKEIKDRADAATFGPWGWFGSGKEPYLATHTGGRVFVMMPRRSGMNGATIFWQGPDFAICPTTDFAVKEREYREQLDGYHDGIDHPDAKFIAHAREDIPALLAHIAELEAQLERVCG